MIKEQFDIAVVKYLKGDYEINIDDLNEEDRKKYKIQKFMLDTLLKFYNDMLIKIEGIKKEENE